MSMALFLSEGKNHVKSIFPTRKCNKMYQVLKNLRKNQQQNFSPFLKLMLVIKTDVVKNMRLVRIGTTLTLLAGLADCGKKPALEVVSNGEISMMAQQIAQQATGRCYGLMADVPVDFDRLIDTTCDEIGESVYQSAVGHLTNVAGRSKLNTVK